jgi:hypothetical protein
MKLELGAVTSNVISGKIFLALPDTEQSVVAGQFKAVTTLASAAPTGEVTPAPPVAAPAAAENPAFRQRYGKKR